MKKRDAPWEITLFLGWGLGFVESVLLSVGLALLFVGSALVSIGSALLSIELALLSIGLALLFLIHRKDPKPSLRSSSIK
ncbi:hypothetical protein [Pontibacillus marinus]|uniref:hypothetical protein n=1 Tax=Pontibacillus marinus TaxID=273164 RepID=UPI0018CE35E3|nr:hypothetical protein [Pontibacillus marinus]